MFIPPKQSPQQQIFYDDDIITDNSRWELDYQDVIYDFEHSLRCEKKQPDGQWVRPTGAVPKLNETGVSDIISDLKIVMHKGSALGNITTEYALDETKALAKAFAKKLVFNTLRWEVNKTQRMTIVLDYAQQVYMTLTRPIGDKERIHRAKKIQFSENYKHDEVNPNEIGGL